MSPEALRRRMAHGNIYRPEKVDAALANYFRVGNLAALRELALLWLAEKVDAALEGYRFARAGGKGAMLDELKAQANPRFGNQGRRRKPSNGTGTGDPA